MSRISSYAVNTQLINRLLKTQNSLLDYQTKLNTEKESQDYAGISVDSQRLINMEGTKSRLERYIRNNDTQQTRMSIAATAVESLRTTMTDFRKELTDYSLGEPLTEVNVNAIQDAAFRALRNMEDLLNVEVDGRFLFAGSRSTTAPVELNVSSRAAFQQTFDGSRVKVAETRDAHLESFSFDNDSNNEDRVFIDDTRFLRFERDSSDSTTTTGSSTIQASSALFSQLTAGATIDITNSSSNNGSYTVSSVSSDGTTVTINTEMLTDETIVGSLTTETPAGAVSFLREADTSGTASLVGGAGATSFNATTNIISSTNGTFFSGVTAGEFLTVSGSGSNNFTVKVDSVSTNGSAITIDGDGTGITLASGTALNNVQTGQLAFSRANDTITAANAVFSSASVGENIVVTGSDENNGTYTISAVSSDLKTITVNSTKLTDEGIGRDGFFTNFNGEDTIFTDTQFNFSTSGTITANRLGTGAIAVDGIFNSLTVGTTLTIAGATDAGNNTTYTVTSISGDGSQIAVTPVPGTTNATDTSAITLTPGTGSSMNAYYTQSQLVFTDLTNTIAFQTSTGGSVAGAFTGLSVGQEIKLSGSPYDDTYTIASIASDGSSITVSDPNGTITADATDTTEVQIQALPTNTFFNMRSNTDVFFNATDNTIEVRRAGASTAATTSSAVPDIFNGLAVGQQITIGGAANTAMNTTYTISAISADGSKITTTESITATFQDTDGVTFTGSGNSFAYTSSTQVRYIDATNTIEIEDSGGTNVANAFNGLIAGQSITLTGGTYAGTYTISSVSSDKSSIVVADPNNTITADAVDTTAEVNLQVFGATGTIASTSYFQGDDLSLTHRVDDNRSFEFDVQANDPTFEKAIRAMKLVLQGTFGTEGGLEQNQSRVNDALYLLNSALEETVTGTPPFGTELSGSIESVERDIGFDQFLINEINKTHTQFIGFLDQRIADIENADPLDTLTRLLDDERALNASYQTFSRIRQLSLTNFL